MDIDVLALGESIEEFKPKGNTTVGVNDIFRYHPVDHLVLADPPSRFTEPDRYKIIIESTPKKFYCFKPWPVPNFELIAPVKGARGSVEYLDDPEAFCYSNSSPFIACVLAYKLGARRINLYGADFNSHATLSNPNSKATIMKHFGEMNKAFTARGIELRVTERSILSEILPLIQG